MKIRAIIENKNIDLEFKELNGEQHIYIPESEETVRVLDEISPGNYIVAFNNGVHAVFATKHNADYEVQIGHDHFKVEIKDERELLLESLGVKQTHQKADGIIKAPIPGLLMKILVSKGDRITKGQAVAILEAMKMENEIQAPHSGIISEIYTKAGEQVNKDQPILKLEE